MACLFTRSGIWYVKYYIEGKPRYRSLKTKKIELAKKKVRRIEVDLERGVFLERSVTHLREFLIRYKEHLQAKKAHSRQALKSEISKLRNFFSFVEKRYPGARTLEGITPTVISDFMAFKLRKDKVKNRTVNHYRQVLHTMFNYAIKHVGFTAKDPRFPNPAAAVDRYPETHPVITYLEPEQIGEQLQALQGDYKLQCMGATLIFAGLRREELLWLTVKDINLKKRLIYVRAKNISGDSWQPKTRRSNRAVPISTALYSYLGDYKPRSKSVWYFPSPMGMRWDPDNFSAKLKRVNKAYDLDWTCLDYRHTFGTQLAMKGESLYKISRLMGNSPMICERHYAHLVPETMHDTVEFPINTRQVPGVPSGEYKTAKIIDLADYLAKRKAGRATSGGDTG